MKQEDIGASRIRAFIGGHYVKMYIASRRQTLDAPYQLGLRLATFRHICYSYRTCLFSILSAEFCALVDTERKRKRTWIFTPPGALIRSRIYIQEHCPDLRFNIQHYADISWCPSGVVGGSPLLKDASAPLGSWKREIERLARFFLSL